MDLNWKYQIYQEVIAEFGHLAEAVREGWTGDYSDSPALRRPSR